MKRHSLIIPLAVLPALFAIALLSPSKAYAHCDSLDGPVVKAAQLALKTGNVNYVLVWVQKKDEGEITSAFQQTLAVRKLSAAAKELADRYFFETVVRLHRAGEGAPYTGLKPAGRDLGPAIPAADRAIEDGAVEPVLRLLTDALQEGARERFKRVVAKKHFKADDVALGREYVQAYVAFIHYVEQLYEAAKASASGHYHESVEGEKHEAHSPGTPAKTEKAGPPQAKSHKQ
jgi:hypothetical protein